MQESVIAGYGFSPFGCPTPSYLLAWAKYINCSRGQGFTRSAQLIFNYRSCQAIRTDSPTQSNKIAGCPTIKQLDGIGPSLQLQQSCLFPNFTWYLLTK